MANPIDNKKIKSKLYFLLSFLLPILIMLCSFAALNIYPFGTESLIRHDANGYYFPFLSYSGSVLRGEHGLIYSFSQDIGGNIVATIWPYLANPFSWIFSLFQYEQYPLAFSLGILLFIGLNGLFMFLLYNDMYGAKSTGLILSTCYALCGFNICFLVNTPFFGGGPLFLPLALLGLRKLLRGESIWLYAVSIAWPITLQIQMGFAICMACGLFYLSFVFCHKGTLKKTWLRFGSASIIGGFLSAFVWIPEMIILKQGRATIELGDFSFTSNFPLTLLGSRLFTGANSVIQVANGFPAIFCGILPVALTILFFTDKRTDRKRKISYGSLMVIYFLAFYIRFFTSVFQGMTHANWFNFRFSFVFVLLIILAAADEMERLENLTLKQLSRCGLGILFASLFIFSFEFEFVDGGKMLLDLLLLALMGGGLWFHKEYPEKASTPTLLLLFGLCTCFQLYLNSYLCTNSLLKIWEYNDTTYQEAILAKEPLITGITAADKSFYRIESESLLEGSIGNDGLALGYNGIGYAGHTEVGWVSIALERLGIDLQHSTWDFYDAGAPAAMDSLLGIKYMISERDLTEEKGYQYKISLSGKSLYENPYALPIALISDNDISNVTIMKEFNALDNLNKIWSGMTGNDSALFTEETEITFSNHNPTDQISIKYDEVDRSEDESETSETQSDNRIDYSYTSDTDTHKYEDTSLGKNSSEDEDPHRYSAYIEYCFTAKKTGPIYLYDTSPIIDGVGTADDVMQYVGFFQKGEDVIGKLYLEYNIDEKVMMATLKGLHICYADMDLLSEYSAYLKNMPVSIQKESDSHLTGDVTVTDGQRLIFTIPYDKGWQLIVDGKEVPLEKVADIFLSASLEPGQHHYDLSFWPVGLTEGIIISGCALISLIILSIYMIIKNRKRKTLIVPLTATDIIE